MTSGAVACGWLVGGKQPGTGRVRARGRLFVDFQVAGVEFVGGWKWGGGLRAEGKVV